ncbi:hypothetical protein BRC75_04380, partial [Halobacteriales archaeon QH_7_69_31]
MTGRRPTFETRDRERLYAFIEERGGATHEELVEADLLTDPARYRQLVALMFRHRLRDEAVVSLAFLLALNPALLYYSR